MDITYADNSMIIRGIEHFSLEQCFTCGQAFRWRRSGSGFEGVALGRCVYAEQNGCDVTLFGVEESAGSDFIRYFDLERDYGAIKQIYASDEFLRQGMEYAGGIRVLNQPPFETLISFIISSFNNVARISRIIGTLCERYGGPLGGGCFDFPAAEILASLTCSELEACGSGYRAPYIVETARIIRDGFDLNTLAGGSYADAREKLMTLPGVGPKVADCVALYSLGFTQAFPADVWMKRVICGVYGFRGGDKKLLEFVENRFGSNAGIAQQYLFHYARSNKHVLCRADE
jgi:N-glycosylase/DNA lyase